MVIFPIEELKRKSFHLLTLIYIFAYWFLPKEPVLWAMGIIIFFVAVLEGARMRFPEFNKQIMKVMSGAYRESEINKVSGLPWTLSGSFFTMLLFPDKNIVLASLFYLAFGDAAAALVGKRMGKRKIFWGKTLEGSLACFAVCFLVGLFFFKLPLALAGAFAAAVIELFPWALNDNFWMPIISAFVLTQIAPFFM
jgi:glycerol-3-phosphate acyltransferase PlsY